MQIVTKSVQAARRRVRLRPETMRWHKRRTHRQWRQRKAYRGQMVQMDGSHHAWLEERGPRLVLMGYIDDADNKAYARFYEYEGTIPAMDSFKRYIRRNGLPHSVYLDNHSTYKSQARPKIEDELENQGPMSQFERALKELGVEVIHANSAPAKGRVERLFKTLQDRLVKELRLSDAKTLPEANECLQGYLPGFNKRFSIKPLKQENLYRPVSKGLDLDSILCRKTNHPLRNDFTVAHRRKWYQVTEKTSAREVQVQERVNGQMLIIHKGKPLKYKEIDKRPPKTVEKTIREPRIRTRYVPPADHSWRRSFKIGPHSAKREELALV